MQGHTEGGDDGEDRHETREMVRPGVAHRRIAGTRCPPLGAPEAEEGQRRADQHAPGEGGVDGEEPAHERTHAGIVGLGDIEALGIVVGIGQPLVVVVGEMEHPVAPVRDEEAERQPHQRLVERGRARGVTVQHLVLERGVEGHRDGERHEGEDSQR